MLSAGRSAPGSRSARSRAGTLLPSVLLLLAAACASTEGRLRLRAIEIEGNESVPDDEVVERLALEAEDGWSWSDERHLDPVLFERDAPRVARIFRALGYYHATVDAVALRWTPAGEGVVLTFQVTEGPPTILESVEIRGLDGLPHLAEREALAAVALHPGEVITEDDWDATKRGIREALRNHGFPNPTVTGRVLVDDVANRAAAEIAVDPGPRARFGAVLIEGLTTIPEPPIRSEIGVEAGDEFSGAVLDDARGALVNLGLFSSVEVDEILIGPAEAGTGTGTTATTTTTTTTTSASTSTSTSTSTGAATGTATGTGTATATATATTAATPTSTRGGEGIVDVDVSLAEGDMQRLKLGVGLATEQGRQQVEGTASWEHRNLFGGLRRLTWSNRFGWAFNLADLEDLGPSGSTSLAFRQPSDHDLRLAFVTSAKYEAVPTANAYSTQAVQGRIGGERTFRERTFSLGLHNGVRWVDLWNIAEGATIVDNPYLLYLLDATVTLDLRDDPLEPHEGHYVSLLLRVGLDPTGGSYDDDPAEDFYRYALGKLDFRGYYRLHERVDLDLRAATGLVFPLGDSALCPPDERFFAGGANSVRGYPYRAIGDWRTCAEDDADCVEPPPPGGNTFWEFSLELRVRLLGGLSAAAFFDAGNVVDGTFRTRYAASLAVVHPTVGAGLRYRTPVGPIRLDVGVPLQDDARIATTPPVAFQLTIGEAF